MREKGRNFLMEENKMGVMPERKLLFTMAAPMMASMLFQAFYNIVDSVVVAMVSQDALNAVSLAFPVQSLAIALSTGTGVGVNALLSRYLGEKRKDKADQVANTGIFLFFCSAVFFSILGLTLPKAYYALQTENEMIIRYGTDYLSVCMGMCYMLFGQMCFERLLQSTGRTDLAMIPQITGALINMILDPIMTLGLFGCPRMEVKGAAVATLFGQSAACIIGIFLNIRKNKEITLGLRQIKPKKVYITEIYRVGLPSILMQAIGSVMNFFMNRILISFTEAATAAFGAYYKIQSFIFMPIFGLNNAFVPIAAYNYGAGKFHRVKKTLRLTILSAIAVMTVGTILFETIPQTLIGFFSPSDEMLSVGTTAFRIIGVHFPIAGFCIVAGSACQALGKPVYSLITSIFRQLLALLPAAFLLSLTGNLSMVWWAFPIAEVVSLIFSAIFLKRTITAAGTVKQEAF